MTCPRLAVLVEALQQAHYNKPDFTFVAPHPAVGGSKGSCRNLCGLRGSSSLAKGHVKSLSLGPAGESQDTEAKLQFQHQPASTSVDPQAALLMPCSICEMQLQRFFFSFEEQKHKMLHIKAALKTSTLALLEAFM